jgi:hypothetical protein
MKRVSTSILTFCLVVAGCGGGSDKLSTPIGVDGGAPPRVVVDADLRELGGGDGAADVAVAADVADGPGDAAAGVKVTVQVSDPRAAAVVPALQRFAPRVDVIVDSPSFRAEDALKEVMATVSRLPTRANLGTVKLNQVSLQATPETNMVTYRLAETPIDLTMAASGDYELSVVASTVGGAQGTATVSFQIDAGPTIRIDSPGEKKPYKGTAQVDVTITDDFFGPVSDVQMRIGQAPLTFMGPGGPTGRQYTATINFAAFMPALEGEQVLTVRAKNSKGTEALAVRSFVSDNRGPLIANAAPKDGDLIGNVITISAEVSDPAGVLPSSVKAVFANGPGTDYIVPLNPPPAGAMTPTYSAVFDTRNLPFGYNALFPNLSFRASDTLGNESLESRMPWLDNRPPVADLDPPDLRLREKNGSGRIACGWPFDPVGPDAADDGDLVPQIVTLRARIEDQGNEPLSGSPKYIPIASVTSAQLYVLDDTTQPLVVNTNPTARANLKEDTLCDAINPLLVPTTKPMTARDALVIGLVSIRPTGNADLTNDPPTDGNTVLVGDDLSCAGGGALLMPDPICNYTGNFAKAKYVVRRRMMIDLMGQPFYTVSTEVHSAYLTSWVGYGPGPQPSIWTLPPQSDGAKNPLCGGTQVDALANFIGDGWACLAVATSDRLGNKQVSRPMRLCIDKDSDGMECPHKAVAAVHDGTPLVVETVADHGYATGDVVKLNGIEMKTRVNGTWTITVVDAKKFSLDGSMAQPNLGVAFPDWTRPAAPAGNPKAFIPGYVVKASQLPNCTGTQTAEAPMPVVDGKTPCDPWRLYPQGEIRDNY